MTDHDATGWRPIHTEADLPPVGDEVQVTVSPGEGKIYVDWAKIVTYGRPEPQWMFAVDKYIPWNRTRGKRVIAWMPLPEPYGGE